MRETGNSEDEIMQKFIRDQFARREMKCPEETAGVNTILQIIKIIGLLLMFYGMLRS